MCDIDCENCKPQMTKRGKQLIQQLKLQRWAGQGWQDVRSSSLLSSNHPTRRNASGILAVINAQDSCLLTRLPEPCVSPCSRNLCHLYLKIALYDNDKCVFVKSLVFLNVPSKIFKSCHVKSSWNFKKCHS
jgi:hypothetical protein